MRSSPITYNTWLEHGAFWLFIFLFVIDYHFLEDNYVEALLKTSIELITYACIVYINLGVIIPYTLERRRTYLFVLCAILTVILYMFLVKITGLENQLYEIGGWRDNVSMVLNSSLFLLISTLYWYFKKGQQEREQYLQAKSDKLEAELRYLRTQISPHFLFNTLNNVYSLAIRKHDDTAPMVAKLSELLRYILYEGKDGQVSLSSELNMLQKYVAFHLLRKPKSQNIDLYIEGDTAGWYLAPMILITFVENAFKHSNVQDDADAWIKIDCEMDNDTGWFTFMTQNNVASTSTKGGIGLENATKQLELMYSGKYQLETKEENGVYEAKLQISLKKHG